MKHSSNSLLSQWEIEYIAPFSGWDFSHLSDRLIDEKPPWDYKKRAEQLKEQSTALLDMGTGGCEFLASLACLPEHTMAMEKSAYNVPIARARLEPLGVKVVEVADTDRMPFNDNEFDTVLNRHSAFKAGEVFRVLKPGGIFLTQQVGGNNLKDLVEEFNTELSYQEFNFVTVQKQLQDTGFIIDEAKEWTGKIEFKDVGAIVYFLKAIPWIVEGVNVNSHLKALEHLQSKLDNGERLTYTQVRFLFRVTKPC